MEEHIADDQSHYEISLTAGQAFVAFVLLLLSLAASFAFGLMLGRGQGDERLVVRKDTPVVNEASVVPKKSAGEIVELGVEDDDFAQKEESKPAEETTTAEDAVIQEAAPATEVASNAAGEAVASVIEQKPAAATTPETRPEPAKSAMSPSPHFAQLLSTGDQKTAEALAVKLINRGFTAAYVERGSTDKGPIYRVRVRFANETEARAAEAKLHEFSKDVWITSK